MSAERPQTSKPRGICKFYRTERGCYNGDNCKFLHGEHEQLTPFDKTKTCRFFAAGYCRRGSQCWFRHVDPSHSSPPAAPEDEDTDLCSICYEKPVTYGLLGGCSHLFCLRCIREWRDPSGKSSDMVSSGSTKKCPMCRAHSRFITPSSIFYPHGDPRKNEAIEKYKASMARVPCKHFQDSPPDRRHCPFGQDCFYQHLNDDGTPHSFRHGYNSRPRRRRSDFLTYLLDPLDDIGMTIDAIRASLPGLFERANIETDGSEDGDHDGERGQDANGLTLETMQRLIDSLSPLLQSDILQADRAHEGWNPAGEWNFGLADDPSPPMPLQVMAGSEVPTDPALPETLPRDIVLVPESPATGSSGSASSSNVPSTPEDSNNGASNSRFSTVVRDRGRLVADFLAGDDVGETRSLPPAAAGPSNDHSADEARSGISTHAGGCPSGPAVTPAADPPYWEIQPPAHFDVQPRVETPLHDLDPPFVTDGRGRVVWSSTSAAPQREPRRSRTDPAPPPAQPKARRTVSEPQPSRQITEDDGAAPQSRPSTTAEDSIVTDGRGRVIFAGGRPSSPSTAGPSSATVPSENVAEPPETPSTPTQSRSFLGRIFGAMF